MRTSKTSMTQPYMKEGFWLKPENHFWECDEYTEKGKEICRERISKLNSKQKKYEQRGKPINSKLI